MTHKSGYPMPLEEEPKKVGTVTIVERFDNPDLDYRMTEPLFLKIPLFNRALIGCVDHAETDEEVESFKININFEPTHFDSSARGRKQIFRNEELLAAGYYSKYVHPTIILNLDKSDETIFLGDKHYYLIDPESYVVSVEITLPIKLGEAIRLGLFPPVPDPYSTVRTLSNIPLLLAGLDDGS